MWHFCYTHVGISTILRFRNEHLRIRIDAELPIGKEKWSRDGTEAIAELELTQRGPAGSRCWTRARRRWWYQTLPRPCAGSLAAAPGHAKVIMTTRWQQQRSRKVYTRCILTSYLTIYRQLFTEKELFPQLSNRLGCTTTVTTLSVVIQHMAALLTRGCGPCLISANSVSKMKSPLNFAFAGITCGSVWGASALAMVNAASKSLIVVIHGPVQQNRRQTDTFGHENEPRPSKGYILW